MQIDRVPSNEQELISLAELNDSDCTGRKGMISSRTTLTAA